MGAPISGHCYLLLQFNMCAWCQGEVDVILDLVGAVEAGQHLNVANVPPPKNTLHGLTNQRALQVHAKSLQLQVSQLRAPVSHTYDNTLPPESLLT